MESLLGIDPTLLVGKYWTTLCSNFSEVYLMSVAICIVVAIVTVSFTSKRQYGHQSAVPEYESKGFDLPEVNLINCIQIDFLPVNFEKDIVQVLSAEFQVELSYFASYKLRKDLLFSSTLALNRPYIDTFLKK